jgi:uroporphyrin-III C-methyltransferase
MKKQKAIVRIVGAGPGDPELFTIKGMLALQQADVILYDALVSKSLLDHAPRGCKLIYVGKRKGKKEFSQEEINQLLVFYAERYQNIVRLKGGDPFVFGRGHEEMDYIIKRGIDAEVIPGISSAIAAPSAAGIPLTKRGINESFWVVTGMCSTRELSTDIYHAARSSATVIILMGITHLEKITTIFKEARGSEEPIAIIQYATWSEQKIVSGTINSITGIINQSQIGSPAVIVIGKVVDESLLLNTLQQQEFSYFQE